MPPFFAHEGAILVGAGLGSGARGAGLTTAARTLLAHIPGDDLYGVGGDRVPSMVDLLIDLQTAWVGRVDDLLALGLPDWRRDAAHRRAHRARRSVARPPAGRTSSAASTGCCPALPPAGTRSSRAGSPTPWCTATSTRATCARRATGHLVLLDWGDSGVGHPMLDEPAFLERLSPADGWPCGEVWTQRWHREVPGCDPDRAASLLAPIGALRQALIYQVFLDGIEPDERIYHASDPARWLARAATLATT